MPVKNHPLYRIFICLLVFVFPLVFLVGWTSASPEATVAPQDGRLTVDHTPAVSASAITSNSCFAQIEGSGFVYSSTDSSALQTAVDAAVAVTDVVKVAGSCVGVQVIDNVTQTLSIDHDITLVGGYTSTFAVHDPDSYETVLDGAGSGRVVYATNANVTMTHLTVQNGYTADDSGGGIYHRNSDLTLERVIVQNSQAQEVVGGSNSDGGGIYKANGAATISYTTISGNSSDWRGGALYLDNVDATLTHVAMVDNQAENSGGGVYALGASHKLTVTDSVFRQNWSEGGHGGVIYLNTGQISLERVTMSDNEADGTGGALFLLSGEAIVENSTFSNNRSSNSGAIHLWNSSAALTMTFSTMISNTDEGISSRSNSNSVVLGSSIIANSFGDNCDTGGSFVDLGYNLESDTTCGLTHVDSQEGVDPVVYELADNGGGTAGANDEEMIKTHALLYGSPAIDAGDPSGVGTDQRGVSRPQAAAHDIGAYEFACLSSPWAVDNTAILNTAVYCFNQALAGSYIISLTDDITLTQEILTMTNSLAELEILGNGYTLAGDDAYRLLTIDSAEVSVEGLTLAHGYHAVAGGAIYVSSSGTISSSVVISGSTLVENNSGDQGGAIYGVASTISVVGSDIISNSAVNSGGGIYGAAASTVDLISSQVMSNSAGTDDGGGIMGEDNVMSLTSSQVVSNSAGNRGGGIMASGSTIVLTASDLISNLADNNGGGIFINDRGVVTLTAATISQNRALNNGGGVRLLSGGTTLTVVDSTIYENEAANNGGGIQQNNGTLHLINSTLSGNNGSDGGGINIGGGTAYLTHTSIVSNTGVGLSHGGGTVNLFGSLVANSSGNDCTGTLTDEGFNLSSDTSCSDFIATGSLTNTDPLVLPLGDNGGETWTHALPSDSPALNVVVTGTLTTDQRGEGRPAGSYGDVGAFELVCLSPWEVDSSNSFNFALDCFNQEVTGTHLISVTDSFTLTSETVTVSNQLAQLEIAGNGYTIDGADSYQLLQIEPGDVAIDTLTMTHGYSAGSGGAISIIGSDTFSAAVTLVDSIIHDSLAENYGGGLYAERSLIDISGSDVISNTANNVGGGLAGDASVITLTDSTVGRNASEVGGAGIWVREGTRLTLTDSYVISNTLTDDNGGGISTEDSTVTLVSSYVTNNTAGGGGGIYADSGLLTLISSQIISNASNLSGGGIYIGGGNMLVLTSTQVMSNTAGNHGGGIYVTNSGSTAVLTSTYILSNTAGGNGGGAYVTSGQMTLATSEIISNTADDHGGGVFVNSGGDVTLTSSTLGGNRADTGDGGGFRLGGGSTSGRVVNSTFYGNESADEGGAIHNNSATLYVENSTLSENEATYGGGVRISGGTVELVHTSIVSNTGSGGGVAHSSGTLYLSGSLLANNSVDNCVGTFINRGYNLSDDNSCSGSLTRIDPEVLPLADNGGETWTHALPGGSSAIGVIPNDSCVLTTDQRGVARPYSAGCDIGSYEYNVETAPIAVSDVYTVSQSEVYSVTVDGGVLSNDSDLANDELFVSSYTAAQSGLLSLGADGSFVYTAPIGIDGVDYITYTVSDSGGLTDTAVATINVYNGFCEVRNPSTGEIYFSDDGTALQEGVDAAVVDDTLQVGGICTGVQLREGVSQTVYISKSLTLEGGYEYTAGLWAKGDGEATLDAAGLGRVIYIDSGVTVSMESLVVQNGVADDGGGIYVSGSTLELTDSEVSSNQVYTHGGGAGIYVNLGTLALETSLVTNNATPVTDYPIEHGGGIYLGSSEATIQSSQVISNYAFGYGGGIYVNDSTVWLTATEVISNRVDANGAGMAASSNSTVYVNDTLFSNNQASNEGGGIWVWQGELNLVNSTLSENSADDVGGIFVESNGSAVLTHTSIVSNTSATGPGGGISVTANSTATLYATLLAYNSSDNCGGDLVDGGHNLASDGSCLFTEATSLGDSDPELLPLADNGGETATHALPAPSLAVDGGGAFGVASDQRGVDRPQDWASDIGAYEYDGGFSCGGTYWEAGTIFELNVAIECFNQQFFAGHTISITADIPLLTGTIVISNSRSAGLEIWGNGHTLDGLDQHRLFTVGAGEVSIDTLIMSNGYDIVDGGGLYVDTAGELTLSQSTVMNSAAENGGGIHINGGALEMTASDVISNSAGSGAGIYAFETNSVTLQTSNLMHNEATSTGGGLWAYISTVSITSTQVISNEAGSAGGGIYVVWIGDLQLASSHVMSNTAADGGGLGLSGSSVSATIIDSTFYNNLVTSQGGAIFNSESQLQVENSTLSGNHADEEGGAIYDSGIITLTHTTVVSNTADDTSSGVIHFTSNNVTAEGSLFAHNAPRNFNPQGILGVVDAGNNLFSDDDCLPTCDPLLLPLADNGGETWTHALQAGSPAIDVGNSGTAATDQRGISRPQRLGYDAGAYEYELSCGASPWTAGTTFELNTALYCFNQSVASTDIISITDNITLTQETESINNRVGRLVIAGQGYTIDGVDSYRIFDIVAGDVSINYLTMTHGAPNNGTGLGGGIQLESPGSFTSVLTLTESTIMHSDASFGGGLYAGIDTVAHLVSSKLLSNTGSFGGGLYGNESQITIIDSEIRGNGISNSETSGGGIYGSNTTITISGSEIHDNVSEYGGGVYAANAMIFITDSDIYSNSARVNGGGILGSSHNAITLTDTILRNNNASDGAALYHNGGTVMIQASEVLSNTSEDSGGGVAVVGTAITIEDSEFRNNKATASGGRGGALFGSNNATIDLKSSTIISNSAVSNGGGIYATQSTVLATATDVISNTSSASGGGLYSFNGTAVITSSAIVSNTAWSYGTAIFASGNMTLTNSTLSQNRSSTNYGTIYVPDDSGSAVWLRYTTVTENWNDNGGALYFGDRYYLEGTIVAQQNAGPDCSGSGTTFDNGYNIDSDGSCDVIQATSATVADVLLADLANNGGDTWTHALQDGSPAADQIPSGDIGCGTTIDSDQRGASRPDTGSYCSIGAYEYDGDRVIDTTADSYQTELNTTLVVTTSVLDNDSSYVSHRPLSATIATSPTYGTIDMAADGTFVYTSTNDFSVEDTFNYVAYTENGITATGQIMIAADTSCYVSVNDGNVTDYNSSDGSAVQEAIDAAGTGDLLKIAGTCVNGTATYLVDIPNKDLTLRGGYTATDWTTYDPYRFQTVLDGDGQDRVIYVSGSAISATLEGLVVTNGSGADGGGIYLSGGALLVRDSAIVQNVASANGGGVYQASSSSIELVNSTVAYNTAPAGAGLFMVSSHTDLQFSTIMNNSAAGFGSADGAGFKNVFGTVDLASTIVAQNIGDDQCLAAAGTNSDGGYNLASDTSCGAAVTSLSNTLPGVVVAFVDGLPIWYASPSSSSAVVDQIPAGANECGSDIVTDQRGVGRPYPSGGACDIGAYEYVASSAVAPSVNISLTLPSAITLSWAEAEENESYDLYYSPSPYSGFGLLSSGVSTPLVLTDDSSLAFYFYSVQAVGWVDDTAESAAVGVFRFELTPGE